MTIKIAVINAAPEDVSDADVMRWTAALQVQVHRDFLPRWPDLPQDVAIGFAEMNTSDAALAGYWRLVFLRHSDQGAYLGYHDLTVDGLPLSKIFVADDLYYGNAPSVTASHEILEMLADPYIDKFCRALGPHTYLPFEVCDAVEGDAEGYLVETSRVSNFVLPSYFTLGPPPWDFRGLLSGPAPALRPGGYHVICEDGLTWRTVWGATPQYHLIPKVGSRRERRRRMSGFEAVRLSSPRP